MRVREVGAVFVRSALRGLVFSCRFVVVSAWWFASCAYLPMLCGLAVSRRVVLYLLRACLALYQLCITVWLVPGSTHWGERDHPTEHPKQQRRKPKPREQL